MLNEGKSKEELMDKINELKAILESNQESTQKIIENERVLSQTALELVDLSPSIDIYDFIAKKLANLIENAIIAVSMYDGPSDSIMVRSVIGENKRLNELSQKILGGGLTDIKIPLTSFNEFYGDKESKNTILSGKLLKMEDGLYQVFSGQLSKNITRMAELTLNMGDMYGTGFESKGRLYGTVYIFLKNGNTLKNKELVQSLISLFAVAIQRKQAENEIKTALEEKEMLLKEIHHRVKNNLMIISSLLNLQSSYIHDEGARDVFKESQNRANSMALIHERLYQSTDLKNIDFGDYIRSLTTDLYHTMVADPGQVRLDIDVEDVKIDINTVVPLGLIVNELVTNSMKHAFPGDESGHIKVEFYLKNEKIVLKVSDNGIGFPTDLDYKNTSSLGLQLVNNLTSQIDGELELDRSQGTAFTLVFEEKE
ncbi:sensor histidine kinase [Methanobacterium petrolearium]|uniref:sensor histidine kinase n=1 Tax=Methanobacterium petrolearium TaxID=710190 RepID=UPI001FD73CB3|nr:histidine kinase dimerization/phosphoacceptor domain -containing protein [Methanobacterium petrolearium]MBP1945658.1 two-component sensor histidine kinase [Methanobacterium petrolearium]BDZ71897.1 hypothetical protein GCM10025861_24140 [Methanobacterium petrolearium]